ncbi:PqqD family protein [Catellatospora coxensis]
MSRPALLPGLRPMWRDRHTVQLGTDPEHAVVLELPHRSAARLLDLLDGSRTERALLAEMARLGMRSADVHDVLAALTERGLVLPAHALMPAALPAEHRARLADEAAALALRRAESAGTPARVLQRRGRARVIVAGSGPTARLIATALLDAGVGKVGTVASPARQRRCTIRPRLPPGTIQRGRRSPGTAWPGRRPPGTRPDRRTRGAARRAAAGRTRPPCGPPTPRSACRWGMPCPRVARAAGCRTWR